MLSDLPFWLVNPLLLLNRWVHIVATTLLVGGILFFEFVVPLAVEDLNDEQRLAVFGRARWVFRKVIWVSTLGLILSGVLSAWRMWPLYTHYDLLTDARWLGSKPWFIGHAALALMGIGMALRLTSGRHLLARPVRWMQLTLMLLLVAIFLADVSRHVRLQLRDFNSQLNNRSLRLAQPEVSSSS